MCYIIRIQNSIGYKHNSVKTHYMKQIPDEYRFIIVHTVLH